jgi:hypothetical protein
VTRWGSARGSAADTLCKAAKMAMSADVMDDMFMRVLLWGFQKSLNGSFS